MEDAEKCCQAAPASECSELVSVEKETQPGQDDPVARKTVREADEINQMVTLTIDE